MVSTHTIQYQSVSAEQYSALLQHSLILSIKMKYIKAGKGMMSQTNSNARNNPSNLLQTTLKRRNGLKAIFLSSFYGPEFGFQYCGHEHWQSSPILPKRSCRPRVRELMHENKTDQMKTCLFKILLSKS